MNRRNWAWMAAVVLMLLSISGSIYVKTRIIETGYAMATLQTRVLEAEDRLGQLRMELHRVSAPAALERRASELGMRYPQLDEIDYYMDGTIREPGQVAQSQSR